MLLRIVGEAFPVCLVQRAGAVLCGCSTCGQRFSRSYDRAPREVSTVEMDKSDLSVVLMVPTLGSIEAGTGRARRDGARRGEAWLESETQAGPSGRGKNKVSRGPCEDSGGPCMSGRRWRRERWSVGYESKRQAHDHRHAWPGGGKYSNRAVKAAEDLRREPGQGRPR